MDKFEDRNNPGLAIGDEIHGYRLDRIVALEAINSVYYELVHEKTAARHVHIGNDDSENTFSVAFKTVPTDSTGVAHILEHTVLCGSQKFPVRDPFFSMLRRSLSTFMNAFTASDWTMYPFSTQNQKDFYNLMDVYLDAVFFPHLEPLSFKQEGHRLEVKAGVEDSEKFELQYQGVVYNEMKGAMSSPNEVLVRSLMQALYPETTYHFNSGGDPVVIPKLTYAQLKAFHQRHYHPSNAFFYTYGNLPLGEHLAFIQERVLARFERIDPRTDVISQPRWEAPRRSECYYPLGPNEDPEKKCQVCLAWLTADVKDTYEVLILTLLEQVLLGNAASPLRKALIDSNLGTALSDGTGFDADNRDTLFAAGLKDVKKSDADAVEKIIMDVFGQLVDEGIDEKLIESAIHQLEFHRKEITNHPYPYGIKLFLTFSGSWFHGSDPVDVLNLDVHIARLREALAVEPLFEMRIKQFFLNNPHRVCLTLVPDPQMEAAENSRVVAELAGIKAHITPAELEKIKHESAALKTLQESLEDVGVLPTLEREDIPPKVKGVQETTAGQGMPAVCYRQPTAGIFYFAAAAGTGNLSQHLVPLVPFFCHSLPRTGSARRDYADMVRLIDAHTGGIGLSSQARNRYDDSGVCLPFVAFNGKCLVRNQDKMFEIITELLCDFDFSDLGRLKNLLLEYRAGLETMVVRNGHRLAMSLAARNFSPALALDETWHGIHQLTWIKALTADLSDGTLRSVSADLMSIGRDLIDRNNFKMALIGERQPLASALNISASIRDKLADQRADGFHDPGIELAQEIPREGWSTATAVSFVAQAFETVRMGHEDAPALAVISKLLRALYLHREIREKGGAYGGFAIYNSENGLFFLGSYRDPHIVATLDVYRAAADFIRAGNYTDEDVKEAILQVCSEIDKPDPPGPAARQAFYRSIVSLTDEARNRFKHSLLTLTCRQVKQVAETYFDEDAVSRAVAVISGEERLKAANEKLTGDPLTIHRI